MLGDVFREGRGIDELFGDLLAHSNERVVDRILAFLADSRIRRTGTPRLVHELLDHIARFRGKQIRPACLFLSAMFYGDVDFVLRTGDGSVPANPGEYVCDEF